MLIPTIIALTLSVLYIVRIGIFYLDTYLSMKENGWRIKINYENFKSFYEINPKCYELYRYEASGPCVKYMCCESGIYKDAYIYFNRFTDWLKVKRMFHKIEKEEKRQEQLKSIDRYLKSTEKDLEEYCEKNDKELQGRRASNAESLYQMLDGRGFKTETDLEEISKRSDELFERWIIKNKDINQPLIYVPSEIDPRDLVELYADDRLIATIPAGGENHE